MRNGSIIRVFVLRLALVVAGLSATLAFADADPPGRVARVNYSEGAVSFAPAGDNEFTDADINRPLVVGDKLWTDKAVRAEIQVGSAAVRMDGRTQLAVLALDDQTAQLSVTQGTVYLRVRSLPEGENFEIDTPNLAYRAAYPGDYRIDVDAARGTTRVTIHSGTGSVYGEKGQALPMGGGQQITFKGRALAQVDAKEQPPQDNFDRWSAERNRREDQSVAARYVPREVVGYQLLDASGQWQQDATYGVVWIPQAQAANWAPYRNGRWEWIAPWGWTWIDEQPWAFVTSHYGRWALLNAKWAWVPGRLPMRPIYSPALVAFVGAGSGPLSVGGKQAVAWFPLAPGEAWQPAYRATPLYIASVNANMPPQPASSHAFQHKPEALTAVSLDDFNRGKPAKGSAMRVAANALASAQVTAPPGAPERAKAPPAVLARAPQPSPDIKPALDSRPTAQQQVDARKQAELQAQREAEAQRDRLARAEQERAQREQLAKAQQAQAAAAAEQARVAELARRSEQAKAAEQQRRASEQQDQRKQLAQQQQRAAEQAKLAQQQQRAEQARLAQQQQRAAEQAKFAQQQQRAAEQARREQVAAAHQRAEQVRREQVARREQARREQLAAMLRDRESKREQAAAKARAERELQARRAQEGKRLAAAAKKDEDARRTAHAQQVEQARRAAERDAQVLQAQRAQREAALRNVAEDKERAQREAWQRQQQALAEQFKREQQLYEEQQRQKAQQRQRPDLRRQPQPSEPEVWQRGVPILTPGRTS